MLHNDVTTELFRTTRWSRAQSGKRAWSPDDLTPADQHRRAARQKVQVVDYFVASRCARSVIRPYQPMPKYCFSIPLDATVRISAHGGDSGIDALDQLSKAVAQSQGVLKIIPGDPAECVAQIPDDEAESTFKLMASEILQAFEVSCPK